VPDYLDAALYFERRAKHEPRAEERDRLLLIAAKYRQFATADARRLIREMPKRPAAPSVQQRATTGKRANAQP
jgi:hypothetical protein